MFRHIFIGTFKEGISDANKAEELEILRAIKEKVSGILGLQVGLSTGWIGSENSVVMTVDFAKREDFDAFIAHPYHTCLVSQKGAEYFTGYVAAQFEL